MRLRRRNMADLADRHYLYQESVQDTQSEIDFVEETWAELRDRPAELLREDFCGTANTACTNENGIAAYFSPGRYPEACAQITTKIIVRNHDT